MKDKLSNEKTEILKGFENGEWVPVDGFAHCKKELVAISLSMIT